MNFFPACHKLCENHSTIINFWITFIFLKHYLPILCPDIRKTMLLSRFLEVFHPFRIKGLCNGDTTSFQKFFISKDVVPIFVSYKLYNNSSWLLTRTFPFPQPVTPIDTYLRDFNVFSLFLMTSKIISSVFSVFVSVNPWITKADLGLLQHPRWSALW